MCNPSTAFIPNEILSVFIQKWILTNVLLMILSGGKAPVGFSLCVQCWAALRLYCRWQPGFAAAPGKNLEIQFATVRTVNFFANFINAAKMFGCADAIMLWERGLGRAVAYGWGRLMNYRLYWALYLKTAFN